MKDINIIMPEEVKDKEKVVFICINRYIIDMNQYSKILATKDIDLLYNGTKAFEWNRKWNEIPSEVVGKIFSARERIAVFPVDNFPRIPIDKFFIDDRNCFQVNDIFFNMKKSGVKFLDIHLSGKPLPYFYEDRLFRVPNLESLLIVCINYYSYSITRLEIPYQDKCLNYKTTKQAAIARCVHDTFIGNQSLYTNYDLIDENNYVYQNRRYKFVGSGDVKNCKDKYSQSSCKETVYFNQINMIRKDDKAVFNRSKFNINARGDDISPSFIMESKARIGLIDLITYIMGALGSWIGFSFFMINPIPFIFKIRDNAISDSEATPSDSNRDEISDINRQDSNRMKSRIRSIEYKLHTVDKCLGGKVEDVSQKMSVLEQKMSAQEQTISAMQQQISTHGQKLDQILREITALKTSK